VTNLWAPIQSTVVTRVTPTPNQLPLVDRVPYLLPVIDRGPLATYHSSMAPPSAIVAKDDTSTMFKLGAFDGSSPRSLMLQGLGLVVVAAVLWWYAYP
jgi:hypothetical protein